MRMRREIREITEILIKEQEREREKLPRVRVRVIGKCMCVRKRDAGKYRVVLRQVSEFY